jgi:hypothetical protein
VASCRPEIFEIIDFEKLTLAGLVKPSTLKMILIKPEQVPEFHEKIQEAISSDSLQLKQLELPIKSVLKLKILKDQRAIDLKRNKRALYKLDLRYLNFELGKASIKLLNNTNQLVPIKDLADKKFASISFNSPDKTFTSYLDKYAKISHFEMNYNASFEELSELWNELINYDLIVCSLHEPDQPDQIQQESIRTFLAWLSNSSKCIAASFLPKNQHTSIPQFNLISAPEDSKIFHEIIPQIIFGGIKLENKLNVVSKTEGSRLHIPIRKRLGLTALPSAKSIRLPAWPLRSGLFLAVRYLLQRIIRWFSRKAMDFTPTTVRERCETTTCMILPQLPKCLVHCRV